jgi:hypothetical protein
MGELLIVSDSVDAGAIRGLAEEPTAFKIEYCHFSLIATSEEEGTFFIERYAARTFAPVRPPVDDFAVLKIDRESSTSPHMSECSPVSDEQRFRSS